ncbi:nucleoporin subcomplex protein binding to Pom34-domain-containing protein [Phanerochaete sordida]|uniref:Nucleoporin NUP188 n=1 Tax=Phanerochaete sordida TaxID=48140 RepID=A0A9P3G4N1_9APHY|nr:nucleoporin subcomplex protein binding to Pom34-domain-containing protein [Phanerochaete sordida]
MSGETSKRSNLIDVTYHHLHTLLSGQLEGTTVEQVTEYLKPRVPQFGSVATPFGKPNDASKKKVDSGSVKLRDGVAVRVEDADKEFVLAISKRFDIDEVEALVLLRSFLYNEGLPESAASAGSASIVEELLDAITPFYYSERLYVLRILIPLFRANAGGVQPVSDIAADLLPEIIPDGKTFAATLIAEYVSRSKARLPSIFDADPRKAVAWAKQNVKEQLVIQEVLFWTVWDYAPCDGPLVAQIYETSYQTNLGSHQENSTLLLDEEGAQLQQDMAALWILITIEVLELERAAEPGGIEVSHDPEDKEIYWSSPESLERIHDIVTSHPDSQFACQYIAWAFVLSRIVDVCTSLKELPSSYSKFFDTIVPTDRSYTRGHDAAHVLMSRAALGQDAGLFQLMLTLLTNSPVFVTSMAWRTASSVTDPNAVAYRSVLKGLVISIVELVPVELIPGFEGFVEVWIALFGRSESQSVSGICRQYWQSDWFHGSTRRAILDVARSRFPVQSKPLVRLLRAMTASGFLDTDPLATVDHSAEGDPLTHEDRAVCAQSVFLFLDKVPTYTQVIPVTACGGSQALYEKLPERMISASVSTGPTYTNSRPIKLPGGATLPPRSIGRLLNDAGEYVVVSWQFEHSGWKVLLEILTDYVNRRRRTAGGASHHDVSFGRKAVATAQILKLEDIGVELDDAGDDTLVTEILDLIRSVTRDHPELAEQLLESFESGDPVVSHSMLEAAPPDLVQLTTMILEDALSRASPQQKQPLCAQLITSAMSVLAALLALPKYSNRVWLYIRSTSSLFGSERAVGFTSAVIASERITGHYTMTLALLHLVRQLFNEASSSVLSVLQESPKLQQVKEEVLMRAARFVHSEIWVEHVGWKYAQLGDRFEIGRRVSSFYTDILKHSPPAMKDTPFGELSKAIFEALITRATPSAVNPLITAFTTSTAVLTMLYSARRYGDARRLIYMLESHLLLVRVLLHAKLKLLPDQACLLEQALCTRVSGAVGSLDPFSSSKLDPIEALAAYSKERRMGLTVPVEAMEVLFALCVSLSSSEASQAATIVGYLADPESTVASLVRIIMHPYDDALLRTAVWNFITLAMDKEPALAGLFVRGQFRVPSTKGKEKATNGGNGGKANSALAVACNMLEQWEDLWELNPQLLASLLRFLDVVWEHGHEHKSTLDAIRDDAKFFGHLASIIKKELGPVPDFRTETLVLLDGTQHSDLHDTVASHAYRTMVKSHALHVIGLDIRMALPATGDKSVAPKPKSYLAIQDIFKDEDTISELISEAASRAYDPSLYDELQEQTEAHFPALIIDHLLLQEPLVERTFGDDFAFSTSLLQQRLATFSDSVSEQVEGVFKKLMSINLNLSLAHAQTTLTESWQHLLLQAVPFLRGDAHARTLFLAQASNISTDIALETRSGGMMSTIHHARLSLLLSLLEVSWFSQMDKKEDVQHFVALVKNLRGVLLNAAQPPAISFLGQSTVPFHRPLLQILYYCSKQSRTLARKPKALNAEQRLSIHATVDVALNLTIDALRLSFDTARTRLDIDLDQDMEQLVAIFEECTRPTLTPSTTLWLTRCQETDVIRSSLQLFSQTDLAGYTDVALLRLRKQPLYAPHVLTFHLALASIPSAAERLASEGVLAAYSENSISSLIKAGSVDVVLPELPGERSPIHSAYCTMLAVVAGVMLALGPHGHYFVADACGFVQLYGDQIHRALSWTIGDSLTTPLLEEIEQTANLFYAISSTPRATSGDEAVKRALEFFTMEVLLLLQQVNYALTHHNHLASAFEPITTEERVQYEADSANAAAVSSASDMVDLTRRPFVAGLVHKLFTISGSILSTLVNISKAESVLLGEPDDWPTDQALLVPHTKVVLGEPVSIGTLLELGNGALDVLKYLVDRPALQSVAPAPGKAGAKALDVRDSVLAARRTLEAALFYGATQLALWLAKPEFDVTGHEPDAEPGEADGAALRKSVTLTERIRRGMSGEMAADLQALVVRAKPVVAKSQTTLDGKAVDITQVLAVFVQERIMMG